LAGGLFAAPLGVEAKPGNSPLSVELSDSHPRRYAVALLLGSVVGLTACGTPLHPVDDGKTAKLLSPQQVLLLRDTCSQELKYADQARHILVYRVDFDHQRPMCALYGPYELVVILDRDERVQRYRLLRVR
jgi:hypothetical protein